MAADQVVTSNADDGGGDLLTLREAIAAVGEGDEITFNLGSGSETITLASTLTISMSMTINGNNLAGSGKAVNVSGNNSVRVFMISNGAITLENMTISDGNIASSNGAGISYSGSGVGDILILNGVTISGNTISNGNGAGLMANSNTTISINNSTFYGNTTNYNAGGIFCFGCTMSLENVTIAYNTSNRGGGILLNGSGATLTVKNSILANNTAPTGADYYRWTNGTLVDDGYNVVESQAGSSQQFGSTNNLLNTDPTGLGSSLTYDGGYTLVLKVTAGNLTTTNAGSTAITTDQRGYYRTSSAITRGAYQYNGIVAKNGSGTSWTGGSNTYSTIQAAYSAASGGNTIVLAGTAILESGIGLDGTAITIEGAGSSSTYVQAAQSAGTASDRVFNITDGAVTLKDMTVRYGNVTGHGGGISQSGGTLTLDNISVSNNAASGNGDGIYSVNPLTVSNSADLNSELYSTSTVTLTDASSNLKLSNATNTISGTFTANSGTVTYDGATQTINDLTYYHLTLSGTGAKTASDDITVQGIFTNTQNLTVSGTTKFLTISGTSSIGANITTTGYQQHTGATTITDNVILETGAYNITFSNTIEGTSADNLTLNAGGSGAVILYKTLGAGGEINNLSITSGGVYSRIRGNITTSGNQTFNGLIRLENTSNTNIFTSTSNGNLTFDAVSGSSTSKNFTVNTGGTVSIDGTINTIGLISKQGAGDFDIGTNDITATGLTLTAGTFNNDGDASGTWDINGNVAINGGTLNATSGTFKLTGNWINSGTFIHKDGTVVFDGADQNIGAETFYNLTASGSGTKTIVDDVTVSNDLSVSGSTLKLQSDASGTGSLIVNGTSTGDVDVQRYIPAATWETDHGWHFLSSPVASQAISTEFVDISGTISSNVDFYRWSETLGLWINIKNGSNTYNKGDGETYFSNDVSPTFETGKGYLVAYSTNQNKTFSGALRTTDYVVSGLTNTPDASYLGSHLLGNPFPCALRWNQTTGSSGWNLANLYTTAKIWHGTNASYSDISQGGYIPAMQGFMVNVEAGKTGSLSIYEGDRVHNSTAWYKETETNRIKLTAYDPEGGTAQESIIKFNSNATNEIDVDYDSYFMSGYAPLFYSSAEEKALSTNTLPELNEELSIPLYFTKNNSSTFYIEADGLDNLIPAYPVYLTDLQTNYTQNLTENPIFSFTSDEGDDSQRFLLHFKAVGVEDQPQNQSNIQTWASNNTIHILNPENRKGEIRILNMFGQQIAHTKLNGNTKQEIQLNVPSGCYLVNVISEEGVVTRKVIVE